MQHDKQQAQPQPSIAKQQAQPQPSIAFATGMAAGEKTPLTRDVELGGAGKAAVRTRLRIDNACCEAEATLAKKTLHAIAGVDKVSVLSLIHI